MKNSVKILILLVCFFSKAYSQPLNLGKISVNELDSFVNKVLTDWQVPGLSLAIVKDGKVLYANGYGVKNLKSKEKVSTKTLFSIASATKSFTAMLAAMMYDEKKLDWDVPLKNYFPDFVLYDEMASAKITLKDLMSHRSGIPRQKFYSLVAPTSRLQTRSDMKYFEPVTDFRNSFNYCNETFAVAGDMIADRAGTTWENLVQKRILEPLEMKSTILSYKDLTNKDFATPYITWTENPEEMEYHNADMLGGAGCIISNVEDLSKWLLLNLNKGKVNEKQLVNPRTLTKIQTPITYVSGSSKYKEIINQCYGIGWFTDSYRGFRRSHHGGGLYGFTSLVSLLPTENIGIVILANLNGTPLTEIIEAYVYDNLLGITSIDWNKRNLDSEAQIKEYFKSVENQKDTNYKPEIKSSLSLKEYKGKYISKGYGAFNIDVVGDSLMTSMLGVTCPLRRYNKDIFELYNPIEHGGWQLTFIINEKNKVEEFQIELSPNLKPIIYRKEK